MERLNEIEERLSMIKNEIDNEGADLNALETEITGLQEERKEINEKVEARKALTDKVVAGEGMKVIRTFEDKGDNKMEERKITVESPEYRTAWLKSLQGVELTEVEKRDMVVAGTPGAIPTQTAETLFGKMIKLAPMLSEITLLRVAGNVQFATEGVRNAAYQHAENAAITAATDTLVKVSLTGYEYNKLLYVSKTVSTMAVNAFESWLVDMIAEDIAAIIEDAIINGSGSSAPKGVAYAGTWTAGTNLVVCTGTYVITYADIVSQIAQLPARYDANAKFLASKAMVYQGLANIKDTTGRPILINDATAVHPFKVLGYPVIISEKVAAKTLWLGDFKKVVGNLSQDVIVERDASAGFASNSVAYRGGAIFDCNIALADAFVKLTVLTY